MPAPVPAPYYLGAKGQVRGTQAFVRTFARCWRRPSLTVLEVLWRWVYGIPLLFVLRHEALQIMLASQIDLQSLRSVSLLDPMKASAILGAAIQALAPPVFSVAEWLLPSMAVAWVVLSSVGRTLVLKRGQPALQARPATLMLLQVVRLLALSAALGAWVACLGFATQVAITGPARQGIDPNLVLYAAIVIVSSLGLFVLWSAVSWVFSIAPLLAMLRGLGAGGSLLAAVNLKDLGRGPLRMKLVEINLVLGITKIAVIILTIVFSATPLPFETVTTQEFLLWWWSGVAVFYVIASDFFHVVRLMSYLTLWETYTEGAPSL